MVKTGKTKRNGELFLPKELSCGDCLPLKNSPSFSFEDAGFVYTVKKRATPRLSEGFPFTHRSVFFTAFHEKERIAALQFQEFSPGYKYFNDDSSDSCFLDFMDVFDDYVYDLGVAISEYFELYSVFSCGSILDFKLGWQSSTHQNKGVWSRLARHVIANFFPRQALLIMKPFPLDRQIPQDGNDPEFFERRRNAMIRYYHRIFHVRPLTDKDDTYLFHSDRAIGDPIERDRRKNDDSQTTSVKVTENA